MHSSEPVLKLFSERVEILGNVNVYMRFEAALYTLVGKGERYYDSY